MTMSSATVLRKVNEILCSRASSKLGTITYISLAQSAGLNTNCFFREWLKPIIEALAQLDEIAQRNDTPRLSALVVDAGTESPGSGYWRSATFPMPVASAQWQKELHQTEVATVLQYFSKPDRRRA